MMKVELVVIYSERVPLITHPYLLFEQMDGSLLRNPLGPPIERYLTDMYD